MAYAILSRPLANAIGMGAFGTAGSPCTGRALLGLAPAILGETLFMVTTYACYARDDTATRCGACSSRPRSAPPAWPSCSSYTVRPC